MKLSIVPAKIISSNLKVCLNHAMQARTVAILPFLLRMLLPGILSGHDNQASISDPGRHFVRHFALKRRFRSEMDFSRLVASATNRAPILASYRLCELANYKENTTKAARIYRTTLFSGVNETSVQFLFLLSLMLSHYFVNNLIKTLPATLFRFRLSQLRNLKATLM